MARYIDADNLIRLLKDEHGECIPPNDDKQGEVAYGAMLGLKMAISYAETLSTTDVVPRDKVRRIFEEIEQELVAALESNYRAYREHLEKYGDKSDLEFLCMCNAKINTLRGIEGFIEELKEKEKHTNCGAKMKGE